MKLTYTIALIATTIALASATGPLGDGTTPCCTTCNNPGNIKTFSIIARNNLCGESCIDPDDFWKYKVFEPHLQKAAPNSHPCAAAGYTHYNTTETHGFKPILAIKLDMYDNLNHT